MNEMYAWYGLFVILMSLYLFIQFKVDDRKRYFAYFVSGCVLGFYFDIISFTNGYYSYPLFYKFTILGIPFSMTLAEGFSVVITIYLFESIKKFYKTFSVKNKNN